MKITTESEFNVTAKAVLQEGKLSMAVSVAAPYGRAIKRKAAHVVNDFDPAIKAKVEKALQEAIDSCLDDAVRMAQALAQQAQLVAVKLGEEQEQRNV